MNARRVFGLDKQLLKARVIRLQAGKRFFQFRDGHCFERGLSNHFQRTGSGDWEPDPLIMDERFLVSHVRGKGLAIFTGCSHAGIVNVCRHAQELFPATPLYALVGGLHLVYPNEELIEDTIAEIKNFGFRVIIPGHCTGWRAVHAFISAFGSDVVDPLAVGTQQSL